MAQPAAALLALSLAAASAGAAPAPSAEPRVFDTRRGVVSDAAALFDAAARADLVFVGELHDDKGAHRVELELLEALAARGRPAVLVLEMFERDVQPALDDYLAGRIDEADFLKRARPWSNYKADYRPLVELAKAKGWPVVAGNLPRPLASRIAREGLAAADALKPEERARLAAELSCGPGPYRDKFREQMSGMAGHGGGPKFDLDKAFQSQCAKDETMAESAAARLAPGLTVVHVNGVFHSDEGMGAAEGLKRRRPEAQVLVVSITKGASPEPAKRALGDFVVWTP